MIWNLRKCFKGHKNYSDWKFIHSYSKSTNVMYFCGGVQNKNEEGCFLASLSWCLVRVKSMLLEKREVTPPFRARETVPQGDSCSLWVRVEGMWETRRAPVARQSAVWQQDVTGTKTYTSYTGGIIQNFFLPQKSQWIAWQSKIKEKDLSMRENCEHEGDISIFLYSVIFSL